MKLQLIQVTNYLNAISRLTAKQRHALSFVRSTLEAHGLTGLQIKVVKLRGDEKYKNGVAVTFEGYVRKGKVDAFYNAIAEIEYCTRFLVAVDSESKRGGLNLSFTDHKEEVKLEDEIPPRKLIMPPELKESLKKRRK